MKNKLAFIIIISALVIGCAGTPFKWDNARQIKTGMTEKQITELMGAPYQVRSDANGQLWQWVQVDLYGLSGGTRTLSVQVRDGVVVQAPSIPESFK